MDKKKIIFILGFAGFVAMADNWVVSPILPSIAQDLNVDLASASIVIIYALVILEGVFIIGSFSFLGGFIKNVFDLNNFAIGMVMTAFGIMALLAGRKSGKIAAKIGRKKTAVIGLGFAFIADILLLVMGSFLPVAVIAVGLLGFGFMMAHSTFLTIATEFAAKARGIAMSLLVFCFMGGGGIGTAIGGRIVAAYSFERLFALYGAGLLLATVIALLVKGSFQTNTSI